jgi:peptidoglycan hydrolase-like protein with peptidoglycan-binding domain
MNRIQSPTVPTLLKVGDRGDAVARLQRELRATGLYEGPITGRFDDATRLAVEAFQGAAGMDVTGKVEPGTLGSLAMVGRFMRDTFEPAERSGRPPASKSARLEDSPWASLQRRLW